MTLKKTRLVITAQTVSGIVHFDMHRTRIDRTWQSIIKSVNSAKSECFFGLEY